MDPHTPPPKPPTPHMPEGQPQQPNLAPQEMGQPVAYDPYGRPLYAHPPRYPQPQVVHVARNIEPVEQPIPPEILQKHHESLKKYPHLNLSRGEYVISAIKRHPIGLVQIWAIVLLLIVALGALFAFLFNGGGSSGSLGSFGVSDIKTASLGIMTGVFTLVLLGGVAASWVYDSNRFYLTNESVIQEIQFSLFSKHEQTVNLANIEDASYKQRGIIQHMLNYGTIRLSTEGDETTYRFMFVGHPKQHIAVLNNAVEAFKSGRPVMPHTED